MAVCANPLRCDDTRAWGQLTTRPQSWLVLHGPFKGAATITATQGVRQLCTVFSPSTSFHWRWARACQHASTPARQHASQPARQRASTRQTGTWMRTAHTRLAVEVVLGCGGGEGAARVQCTHNPHGGAGWAFAPCAPVPAVVPNRGTRGSCSTSAHCSNEARAQAHMLKDSRSCTDGSHCDALWHSFRRARETQTGVLLLWAKRVEAPNARRTIIDLSCRCELKLNLLYISGIYCSAKCTSKSEVMSTWRTCVNTHFLVLDCLRGEGVLPLLRERAR